MLHQYTSCDRTATSRLQNVLYFIKSYANIFVNLSYNQIWEPWWFIRVCLAGNIFRCYSVDAICNTINVFKVFKHFSGGLEKLWQGTVSIVMLVRPSVRPHGTPRLPLEELLWNLIFENFYGKYFEKNQVSIKYDKNKGYFSCRPIYIFH